MKKAVSTFPFLMIFVIIAGSIILMFFFSFGQDIFSSSEKLNELTILKNIDQQLASFSLPSNAFNPRINLGRKSEIHVNCINDQTILSFNNNQLKTQKLIVSPVKINAKTIQAWTLSWDYPFKIDNFYYLLPGTGDNQINIFIKTPQQDTNLERKRFINDFKFPNIIINNPNEISQLSKNNLIFLLDNIDPRTYSSRATVLQVDFDNPDYNTRKVAICRNNSCVNKKYLGNPMALALAFSNSNENYECIKTQALNKLKDITSIYKTKIDLLKQARQDCDYSLGNQGISDLLSDLEEITTNLENSQNLNTPKDIEKANKNLKLINCPELYLQ